MAAFETTLAVDLLLSNFVHQKNQKKQLIGLRVVRSFAARRQYQHRAMVVWYGAHILERE